MWAYEGEKSVRDDGRQEFRTATLWANSSGIASGVLCHFCIVSVSHTEIIHNVSSFVQFYWRVKRNVPCFVERVLRENKSIICIFTLLSSCFNPRMILDTGLMILSFRIWEIKCLFPAPTGGLCHSASGFHCCEGLGSDFRGGYSLHFFFPSSFLTWRPRSRAESHNGNNGKESECGERRWGGREGDAPWLAALGSIAEWKTSKLQSAAAKTVALSS